MQFIRNFQLGNVHVSAWLLLVGVAAAAAPVQGQLAITSYTIDNGGASASGFAAISGTIGQCDASNTMSGGDFKLAGGFWGEPAPNFTCTGDLDGNAVVGAPDIAILLGA